MKIDFKEEQRFTQWWLWLILTPIGILPIIGIYKQLILGEIIGDNPMPDTVLIILSVFAFCLIGFFWLGRLKTEINQNEIKMSFTFLAKRNVLWKDVESAKIVNYGFVGGWGIRLFTKYGTVYNTNGSKGLAIELINGKRFLIGTQKETELNEAIKKIATVKPIEYKNSQMQ